MEHFSYAIRPAYHEVDKMGYVYHANYVTYCHKARTEYMRSLGIPDSRIEKKDIMMPVISFDIIYKQPAHYDEQLEIQVTIQSLSKTRCTFEFVTYNNSNEHICTAHSTIVFINSNTRKPLAIPTWIGDILEKQYEIA